ncbi:MAG: TDT family transporter [Pseudomonadales bacterium]|nr:TDT family transporter [Pseudomonadales bacterium]NRA18655.1 TDT family transporter [Oceanospirillaceae bacterium]
MHIKLENFLQQLPVAAAGLALGIASLGLTSGTLYPQLAYLQLVTSLIAVLLVILVASKLLLAPQSLWQSISDPAAGPMLPTIAMVLMIASENLPVAAAYYLWGAAVVLHLLLLLAFIISRWQNFQLQQLAPTWFIPPIGIAVASLTNPGAETFTFSYLLLNFAICCMLLMPLMIYRLWRHPALAKPIKPSLALFAAPPNLCLAGYLTFYQSPGLIAVSLWVVLAMAMSLFSYYCFIRLYRDSFSPVFAAFTFPAVIGAAAMQQTAEFFAYRGVDAQLVQLFSSIAQVQILLAALITTLVCYRFIKHFYQMHSQATVAS